MRLDQELEVDLVDRVSILASKVLLDTRQEALCEEEAGDPEDIWLTILDPTV